MCNRKNSDNFIFLVELVVMEFVLASVRIEGNCRVFVVMPREIPVKDAVKPQKIPFVRLS